MDDVQKRCVERGCKDLRRVHGKQGRAREAGWE